LPFADWGHVAVAGHSAGAQASLVYASRGSTPVDAVVSLDTTQDYESLADHGWTEFVPVVLHSSKNMTMPILFAANAHAIFELADALTDSDRDLLTFKDLHHNDFISQGLFKRMLESWSDAAGKDAPGPNPSPGSPQASYEALCEYVLAFLETRLRGDPSRQAALDAKYQVNAIGGSLPHVERIAVGATAAPPYRDAAGKPPEPRQVRAVLKERGPEATMAILKAAHQKAADAPVFHSSFGIALVYELLEKGRKQDAVAFHQLYRSFDAEFRRPFFYLGKSYLKLGMKTRARDFLEKAVALDPGDAEAAEQLSTAIGALKGP
jgi:pimeloyl-ACP methyl ester carboxylesterase